MKDFEVKKFTEQEEMRTFFKEQEQTDRWLPVYTNELETVPLEDNELALLDPTAFNVTKANGYSISGFSADVTPEDITSSMQSTKTSVIVPMDDRFQMYPLRYTAWTHLQKRAGLEGRSINNLKDRVRARELAPGKRCSMLNECLSLYSDMTNVLIRDGKVTALMSGDESDYAIMPQIRLINILENELGAQYSSYKFQGAQTNHEITQILYSVEDEQLERNIRNLLSSNNIQAKDVRTQIQFTTSDTGNCAARLTPMISVDGHYLPIGKSECVDHKGGSKAMSSFIDMTHAFLGKYRENIDCIRRLMDIKIICPDTCLQHIYEKLNLSGGYGKYLRVIKEKLAQEFTAHTAYDIYWCLNEMLFLSMDAAKADNKTVNIYSFIKDQETIGSVLFWNFKEFDY